MIAPIRKISLLLRLVVAGASARSGVSALAIERLIEGRAPEALASAEHSGPPIVQPLGPIRQQERSSATLLFF